MQDIKHNKTTKHKVISKLFLAGRKLLGKLNLLINEAKNCILLNVKKIKNYFGGYAVIYDSE